MPLSRQLSVILVLFCLASGACGGGDDDADRPAPTTTAVSTTTSTTDPAEADEAQLRQLAEDWFRASPSIFRPSGDLGVARDYLVDPYLGQVEAQAADYVEQGLEVRVSDRSRHEIESVEIDGDSATIVECLVDADSLVRSDSGEVVNDGVFAYRTETVAARGEDGWRFSERTTREEFEGRDSCDG